MKHWEMKKMPLHEVHYYIQKPVKIYIVFYEGIGIENKIYVILPTLLVFSPAAGESGLLGHNGRECQEGYYCSFCPHGEESAKCSYGGQTRQPFCS